MEDEPPSKRLRTEPTKDVGGENDHSGKKTNLKINSSDSSEQHEQVQKEIRAGITAYVDPDAPGFTGILKKRSRKSTVIGRLFGPNMRQIH